METQRIQMVKSDREQVIDLVSSLVGIAVIWYLVNPEPINRTLRTLQGYAYRAVHRVSVWNALQAIRSLPETPEP